MESDFSEAGWSGIVLTIPSIGTQVYDISTITYDSGNDKSTVTLGSPQTIVDNGDLPSLSGVYNTGTYIFTNVSSTWASSTEHSLISSSINVPRYYNYDNKSCDISNVIDSTFNISVNSYAYLNDTLQLIVSKSVGSSTTLYFSGSNPFSTDYYSPISLIRGDSAHASGDHVNTSGTAQQAIGIYNFSNYDSIFLIGDGYDDSFRHNIVDVRRQLVTIDGNLNITGSVNITGSLLVNGSPAGGGTVKAGSSISSSFGGSPLTSSITFSTAFSDNNYSVTVTGEDPRIWSIQNKSSTGFTINSNSSVALSNAAYWIAAPFSS
jgi:hypothetical protein